MYDDGAYMELSAKEKARLESEERYRAQVRRQVRIEEKRRKFPGQILGFVIVMVLIFIGLDAIAEADKQRREQAVFKGKLDAIVEKAISGK